MTEQCTVVHCKKSPYDVYVGRPSVYGNPYKVGVDGVRGECVELYRELFYTDQMKPVRELVERTIKPGTILGCWCSPNKCHGDVIAEYVNNGYRKPSQ